MKRFLDLFNFRETIGPLAYLTIGAVAMTVKYLIDRQVAGWLAHKPWEPWNYLNPFGTTVQLLAMGPSDRIFLLVMATVALPFAWLGLSLTFKRLRSVQAPLSYIVLFFIPFINLLLFLLMCILPAKRRSAESAATEDVVGGAAFAVWTSVAVCTAAVFLAARYLEYGWALFVGTPFCLGLLSTFLYSRKKPRTQNECFKIALLTSAAASAFLLCFAFEGIICLLMAAPLALPLAALGAIVGFHIQPHRLSPNPAAAVLILLAVFPPVMVRTESSLARDVEEFAVTSSVEVDAPPEAVWKNVVTFSQLEEPTEILFKSGIAYPIRAEILGQGKGATRYCIFSTGPFVEPITVWNEPNLLAFSVSQVPAPMQEFSPFSGLHPPHLDGFLVSHKGQFLLTALPGNRTRLEGTTWYVHNLWPEVYWRLWSDLIIHRIHLRVLNHVKQLSEEAEQVGPRPAH